MAMNDWNLDGKKDWQDNYIEYQIIKNIIEKNTNTKKSPRNRVSNGRFLFCVIGGLLIATVIIALFTGGTVENVPQSVTLALWIICGSALHASIM